MLEKITYKQRSFLKFVFVVLISVLLVFSLSVVISLGLYNKIKGDLYAKEEVTARSSSQLLTRYIADTYELYHDSGTLKFQEIMGNIDELRGDFSYFQIVTVDKQIVFDSRYENTDSTITEETSDLSYDVLHSNNVYIQKAGGKIDYLVTPDIDDWGNHTYSVKYMVNYNDVDARLSSFKFTLYILVVGINLVIALVLVLFISNEKYQMEKERARSLSEVNILKDEFMILVSHNLRTPLSIIKGYMSFIEEGKGDQKALKENLDDMGEGVQKLSRLVEDIVLATSILGGKKEYDKEKVNVSESVKNVWVKLGAKVKEKNISLESQLKGDETFLGNKELLERILYNVLENSVKFGVHQGKVFISIQSSHPLKITVSDTGVGINKERLDSIIGFFHRGSEILNYDFDGSGVGLYLTNLIVKHYNGQVHIESEEGTGTRVDITLGKENGKS